MKIPFRHGDTLLHIAARKNRTAMCRWLLRLGSDVNRTDILGRTALHHAVRDGAADAARLLVAQGAILDAKDWQGRTVLDLAEAGHGEAAARMIREEISARHARKVKAVRLAQVRRGNDAG